MSGTEISGSGGQEEGFEEVGIREIAALEARSDDIIKRLRETVFSPESTKELRLRFSISEASEMVGRTTTAIREAEKAGRLPQPEVDERGRRIGYKLEGINWMRREFGTLPWRAETDEPVILAIQNFKGGVGKSTITAHTAQYLALQGYRVCVIDCDPQGSTTALFGYNPDFDLEQADTLYPFLLHGVQSTLEYAVRETYFNGISLIPSNLSLQDGEYELARRVTTDSGLINRLRQGIETIKDAFDVLILDPPPALGMLSLSVLQAANALIIPVPPSTVDFGSTVHFFSMLRDALRVLASREMKPQYKFLKVLASKVNENKSAHREILNMMRAVYETRMLDAMLKDSAEIDNATARLMTVYELEAPLTSKDTHNRCKAYLNAVNREIELLIRKTWPSHHQALRNQGLM